MLFQLKVYNESVGSKLKGGISMKGKLSKLLAAVVLSALVSCNTICASVSMTDSDLKVGAWLGVQANTAAINTFQTLQERKLDTIMVYCDWGTSFSSIRNSIIDPIYNNGSTAIITWEQWGLSNQDIIDGKKDSYIVQSANDMKSYGQEIWISLMHEANGNWYDWAIGDSEVNTNETYIAAYRHVVELFRQQGASNVKWIWNVNAGNCGAGTSYLGHYPGDNYVDFIAIDGYNWGTTQSWGSTWQSFDEIFAAPYQALSSINKPIVITEFSCTEIGGNKAEWITDAFATIRTKYPRIKLVSWFGENKETDWRINSSDAALEAYKNAVKITESVSPSPSQSPAPSVSPTPSVTPSPSESATPSISPSTIPAEGKVAVEVNTNSSSAISQTYKISAAGTDAIDLSKLEIKYTFTKDDTKAMNFWCDNAAAQLTVSPWYSSLTSGVSGKVTKDGQNYSVIITFNTDFQLKPGTGSVQLQTRLANEDWSGITDFKETGMQVIYNGQVVK